jgi:prepilin-type N-terminal cleavage/methylation domain-containing protein
MRFRPSSSSGFTLVEVVIGMALFSLFLIASLGSFAALSRLYSHGIATRRAIDNSRLLIEDVSRVARFASSASVASSNFNVKTQTPYLPVVNNVGGNPDVSCGPDLNLNTAAGSAQYQFYLSFTGNSYAEFFTNTTLPSNQTSAVNQNDGATLDITQANAFGISNANPGGYIFCVYNNPPYSYVKISFTINNSASVIQGQQNNNQPYLLFNLSGKGTVPRGIEFTTTVGIGGEAP